MKKIFTGISFCLILLLIAGCSTSDELRVRKVGNLTVTRKAENIINRGLRNPNPEVRVYAIEASVYGDQEMMDKVQELLFDPYVPVRFAAALAIADYNYQPARDDLQKLMKDKNKNVRIAAAYALDKLDDKPNNQLLIEKAVKSEDQKIRANAVMLLGKYGNTSAVDDLRWALEADDSEDKVRWQALEALAKLGDETIYKRAWTLLISAYADDRVMGIKIMSALGTEKAVNSIGTMLKDDLLQVKVVAAGELAKFDEYAGEDIIESVFAQNKLQKVDEKARKVTSIMVADAIGNFCTQPLVDELSGLMEKNSKQIKIAAAKSVIKCYGNN